MKNVSDFNYFVRITCHNDQYHFMDLYDLLKSLSTILVLFIHRVVFIDFLLHLWRNPVQLSPGRLRSIHGQLQSFLYEHMIGQSSDAVRWPP